jgi:hypothetical protein
MLNRSTIRFVARILVLSLIFGAFTTFNAGSTLAAKNKGADTQAAGAQNGNSQSKTAGAPNGNSQLSGQLIANGPVTVNGKRAITGTTIFTGSQIMVDCATGNSAIVNLGKLGRIEMVAGSKLTLQFSDGLIGGELQDGKAVISTPEGVKVSVNTPDGVVSSNCAQACVTPVAVQGFVQCVPVVSAVPAPIPVPSGVGGWALAGGLLGAAGVTGAAVAISDSDRNNLFAAPVSPVTP